MYWLAALPGRDCTAGTIHIMHFMFSFLEDHCAQAVPFAFRSPCLKADESMPYATLKTRESPFSEPKSRL